MQAPAVFVVAVLSLAGASYAAAQSPPKLAEPKLDYDYFTQRVEPIFLAKRAGHARCYVCHAESSNTLRLERLGAGARFWTDEQSHRNFEAVAKLANPGDIETSRLLQHPLAPEGGGNVFHSGGRQFASKRDPDWQALAAWINGARLAAPKK
jgi:hypothetical protein